MVILYKKRTTPPTNQMHIDYETNDHMNRFTHKYLLLLLIICIWHLKHGIPEVSTGLPSKYMSSSLKIFHKIEIMGSHGWP